MDLENLHDLLSAEGEYIMTEFSFLCNTYTKPKQFDLNFPDFRKPQDPCEVQQFISTAIEKRRKKEIKKTTEACRINLPMNSQKLWGYTKFVNMESRNTTVPQENDGLVLY